MPCRGGGQLSREAGVAADNHVAVWRRNQLIVTVDSGDRDGPEAEQAGFQLPCPHPSTQPGQDHWGYYI